MVKVVVVIIVRVIVNSLITHNKLIIINISTTIVTIIIKNMHPLKKQVIYQLWHH